MISLFFFWLSVHPMLVMSYILNFSDSLTFMPRIYFLAILYYTHFVLGYGVDLVELVISCIIACSN